MGQFEHRLRSLERRVRVDSIELALGDGKRISIPSFRALEIAIAAMERTHARIAGEPQPETKFNRELAAIEYAIKNGAKRPDSLLGIAMDVLMHGHNQRRRGNEQTIANAN